MTPLTPDDIERLIALAHHDREEVRGRALDVLRQECAAWRRTTLEEYEDFMLFVWARDNSLGMYLAMSSHHNPVSRTDT